MPRSKRLVLALPAIVAGVMLSACEAPSPSSTPVPSTSTSETPLASLSPTASVNETPARVPTASDSSIVFGDDLTFGFNDFAGFAIGSTRDDFAASVDAQSQVCFDGGHENFYSSESRWSIWVDSYPLNPGVSPDMIIDRFTLRGALLEEPFGPTGPNGIRLGASEADVTAAFPEAEVLIKDIPYPDWDSPDKPHLQHIIPAPDDSFMVVTTVDGFVIDIKWGSNDLAAGWEGVLCD